MPTAAPASPSNGVRRLYAAEMLSGLGDGVFWVGILTAIAGESNFDLLLVLAVFARLGPRTLLSIAGGGLVDRTDVRRLLISAELLRASIMTVLGIALLGGLDVVWVFPGVLASYVVGVPSRPAVSAALPSIVGESELATANALVGTIRQVMTFVGPLVGVAVALWSPPAAFVVNGVSFALSAWCIAGIDRSRWPSSVDPDRTGGEAVDRPPTRLHDVDGFATLVGLTGLMYFVRGTEIALHVLVVRDLLVAAPSSIGYLSGAVGIGAVAAMPLVRRAASHDRAAIVPILVSMALTAVPLAVLASVDAISVASLLMLPIGAGMVLFEVISVITVQRTVQQAQLGRAFGEVNTASNGGKLVGAVITPFVAASLGTAETLLVVTAVVVAGGLVAAGPLLSVSRRAERRRVELRPVVAELSRSAVLRDASQLALERIAQRLSEETVAEDQTIIEEGDVADDLFIVRSGTFRVDVDGRVVNTLGPGDWAGEIGLVHGLPRTATVTAEADATVWRIPGDVFLDVLSGFDDTTALDGGIDVRLARGRSTRSF